MLFLKSTQESYWWWQVWTVKKCCCEAEQNWKWVFEFQTSATNVPDKSGFWGVATVESINGDDLKAEGRRSIANYAWANISRVFFFFLEKIKSKEMDYRSRYFLLKKKMWKMSLINYYYYNNYKYWQTCNNSHICKWKVRHWLICNL